MSYVTGVNYNTTLENAAIVAQTQKRIFRSMIDETLMESFSAGWLWN